MLTLDPDEQPPEIELGLIALSVLVVWLLLTIWCASVTLSMDNNRLPVSEERVDVMEVNHFYDEHGKLVYDQIIFYDWCEQKCRFNVRAWRLLKKPTQVPLRNWQSNGDYVAVWQDGEQLRKVRAATMRESWTQYDPELVERQFLPKDQRRGLCKPLKSR